MKNFDKDLVIFDYVIVGGGITGMYAAEKLY